jgi:acetyl esterase/lipase
VECFKNVNFHLILAEKDGLISQQIAFKTMLDAYKIPNTLKVCPGMTHAMGFFRVPLNMDD